MSKTGKTKIYATLLQKGGSGKSTSTYNLGYELAERGLKVLLVDFDPQANLTEIAGLSPESLDCTIADVLLSYAGVEKKKMEECILQLNDNLFIAPSIIDLSAADSILMSAMSREFILKRALSSIKDDYDCILIDCQPSLSLLPLNALACSDYVLVPCCAEYLHYRGLHLLESTVEMVKENLNDNLIIRGLVVTRYERTNHNKEILEQLRKDGYNILGIVPKAIAVSDAVYTASGAIVASAPQSAPAIAYKEIADALYYDITNKVYFDPNRQVKENVEESIEEEVE